MRTDVLVVGGGLGGVAAALGACEQGARVVLSEPTAWLGGQLTAQAVPLDEHPWIEAFGANASYRRLRDGVRDLYRRWYPLTPAAHAWPELNPGAGTVSRLCAEPRAALAVLEAMLLPHRAAGRLMVRTRHAPVGADVERDRVRAVELLDLDSGARSTVGAALVLDATETGELLPLTGCEHRQGSEARSETGEPHAAEHARPRNHQAATWCVILEHRAGEDWTVDRPEGYERWRDGRLPGWPGPRFAWRTPDPKTGAPRRHTFTPNPDRDPLRTRVDLASAGGDDELWTFRRIAARRLFAPGAYPSDLTVVNWPMADYTDGCLHGGGPDEDRRHAEGAKRLTTALLHWLQTDAPRPDGGAGWPGLRPVPEAAGTADGFAMAPYVREARRIVARHVVSEREVGVEAAGRDDPLRYHDRVGLGAYRIDLHPTTQGDGYLDLAARPFTIPLRALVPVRLRNLLAAGKCLGATHIANGCFRLHPVEWAAGEAAGRLAAWCLAHGGEPARVCERPEELEAFQTTLRRAGVELEWPQVRAY